jgi:hypothetical protein
LQFWLDSTKILRLVRMIVTSAAFHVQTSCEGEVSTATTTVHDGYRAPDYARDCNCSRVSILPWVLRDFLATSRFHTDTSCNCAILSKCARTVRTDKTIV